MSKDSYQSRSVGQVIAAVLAGLVIGLAGGAAIGSGLTSVSNSVATTAGGVTMALVAGWADATRRPGRPQPLWVRILASVFLAAAVGWLLQRLLPDWPLPVIGGLIGTGAAALGARLRKLLIGLVVGLTVGGGFEYLGTGEPGWGVVAAVTVFSYRLVAGLAYRGKEQVRFLAERVAPGEVPFVVPLAERQGYVGVDYLKRHAYDVGAVFTHNAADIGIVESFQELAGPNFDPARAHPSIREFYEHTSRFTLSITPRWRWWMRMPYLLYRETVAKPLGQANVPFHLDEVERGVLSWIDTIDVDEDGIPDFRAWVRAYEGSNEPLYVGIYTTVRYADTGYVSVGFPLPSGSFTATLLPSHFQEDGLRLSSRRGDFQGHYLSALDSEAGEITTVKLESFDEEIEVYTVDGQLSTDHRFYLGGIEFMSLNYEISRG